VGRPVAYYIYPGHPSDIGGSLLRERIPAEDIIHLYDVERVSQTRGVTWFHAVMMQLRMLEGYIEAELVAARTGAAKMGWLEHVDAETYEDPNPDRKYTFDASPGTIETLPPGMKFVSWNPITPLALSRISSLLCSGKSRPGSASRTTLSRPTWSASITLRCGPDS